MSLLDMHLDKVEDLKVVKAGEEYELQITSAYDSEASTGRTMFNLSCKIMGQPGTKPVFESFSTPMEGDSEENVDFFKRNVKKALQAFKLKPLAADAEGKYPTYKGATAWAILKTGEYQGEPKNEVARWIVKK